MVGGDVVDDEVAPQWSVRLEGDPQELEELVALFTSPDLQVARHGDAFFLEAAALELLGTSAEVHEGAKAIASLLNGAAKLKSRSFRDVEIGAHIVEFTDSGDKRDAIVTGGSISPRGSVTLVVVQRGTIDARARVLAPKIVVDGQEPTQPAPGSFDTDRWLELASRDASVGEALEIFGNRAQGWVNLYKVYEIIEQRADIVGSGWTSDNEVTRFTRTANHPTTGGDNARHARSSVQPPPNPLTPAEGVDFIRRILTGWLGSLITIDL